MKKNTKLQTAAVISYVTAAILFTLFLIYMSVFEHNSVYQARKSRTYDIVEDYSIKEISDSEAPVGLRKEYNWTFDDIDTNENCLAFYLVHQYAEVYFDDELIYSLMPAETNKLGRSTSSNWIIIPLYPEDNGKEVRIVITPVYKSFADRQIEFLTGSRSSIIIHRLKQDLPQIILSLLCILLGFSVIVVRLFLLSRKRSHSWDLVYLGNFSILLGLWRITDTRFSPLMFPGNTMVLGYITISMLFLISIPFLLFLSRRLSTDSTPPLLAISTACSAAALGVLFCQISGIAEFRETLTVSHIMIIVSVLSMLTASLISRIKKKVRSRKNTWIFILILTISALFDIFTFYKKGSSSGILVLVFVFLIYMINLFTTDMLEISKNAYTDVHTGLFNKSRWNELMETISPAAGPVGFMMLDLNRLKYVNDTLGHEAGDKIISGFAWILRSTIHHSSVICRWGGDEFAVMITDADRNKMEHCFSAITTAVDVYNQSGAEPEICFSGGWVLSTDYPELSCKELLEKADEQMYQNKRNWYSEHPDAI